MNVVVVTGNAASDAKVKKGKQSGTLYAEFGLAISQFRRETSFINVVAFGKLAEWAEKYVAKGRQYAVVGRVEGKSGRAKVIADRIDFQDLPRGLETQELLSKKALRLKAEELRQTGDTRPA